MKLKQNLINLRSLKSVEVERYYLFLLETLITESVRLTLYLGNNSSAYYLRHNRILQDASFVSKNIENFWRGNDFLWDALDSDEYLEGKEVLYHKYAIGNMMGVFGCSLKYLSWIRHDKLKQYISEKINVAELKTLKVSGLTSSEALSIYEKKIEYLEQRNRDLSCINIANTEILTIKEHLKIKESLIEEHRISMYIDTNIGYGERIYYEVENIIKIHNGDQLHQDILEDLLSLDCSEVASLYLFHSHLAYVFEHINSAVQSMICQNRSLSTLGYGCQDACVVAYDLNIYLTDYNWISTMLSSKQYLTSIRGLFLRNYVAWFRFDRYMSNLVEKHAYYRTVWYGLGNGPFIGMFPYYEKRSVAVFERFLVDFESKFWLDPEIDDLFDEELWSEENILENVMMGSHGEYFRVIKDLGDYYESSDFLQLNDLWADQNLEELSFSKTSEMFRFQYKIKSIPKEFFDFGFYVKQNLEWCFSFVSKHVVLVSPEVRRLVLEYFDDDRPYVLYESYKRHLWYNYSYLEYREIFDDLELQSWQFSRLDGRDDYAEVMLDSEIEMLQSIQNIEIEDEEDDERDVIEDGELSGTYMYAVADSFNHHESDFELEFKINQFLIIPDQCFR